MPIVLTNEPTSGHGGIQRYVARLATALASGEEYVTLIEPDSGEEPVDTRVRYRRFSGSSRLGAFVTALIAYLPAAISSRESTIASIWFPSGLVAAIVPRVLRGSLAIIAHGTEIAPSRRGLRRLLMLWTFQRARVIFANSEFTRGLLAEAGVTTPVVIARCGVDEKLLMRDWAVEPTLLMVGRLIARKGFDRTIEAMPQIVATIGNARLRIVGDGPQRAELELRVRELGLGNAITFLGALDDASLAREYDRAWCFAMPARRIGNDVEGFGIVYLEAAMAGIGSVGGIGSGAEDAIAQDDTGLLVDGNDSSAIARAAVHVLQDRHYAEELGHRARARAIASFSWNATADIIRRTLSCEGRR